MSRGFSGMQAWLLQRFSALYLLTFSVFGGLWMVLNPPSDYAQWSSWMQQPWLQISVALLVIALLIHAWIGLRDVILDYIHPIGLRLGVIAAVMLLLLASGIWAFRALWLV